MCGCYGECRKSANVLQPSAVKVRSPVNAINSYFFWEVGAEREGFTLISHKRAIKLSLSLFESFSFY